MDRPGRCAIDAAKPADPADDRRWAALWGDLDAAIELDDAMDRAAEVAERVIAERGRLRLVDRLRPLLGGAEPGSDPYAVRAGQLVVRCVGQPAVQGELTGVGADWLTMAGAEGREWLIPLARVTWLKGPGPSSAEPGSEGVVAGRLTFRLALRRILRRSAAVTVTTVDGDHVAGVLTTVGHDHIEIALSDGLGSATVLVPLEAIAHVRRG